MLSSGHESNETHQMRNDSPIKGVFAWCVLKKPWIKAGKQKDYIKTQRVFAQ